ncbi:substrate-binding periplasmic protein [Kiloniella majae]|uniref:substrate-binding periplasmic protein n=1 Tax=Kiloniella majae TaxID=1938558 RepID=UPI000A27819C|nr:transporter substrate-binding domain-containing protein [Kiloniella majae]
MILSRLCFLGLLFLAILISPGRVAFSDAEPQTERVYQGLTVPYPPYMIIEDEEITGIVTEIVRTAFDRAGLKLQINHLPMKRALHKIREGQADFMFTLFFTEERAAYMHYAEQPLSYEDIILAVPKGKTPPFDGSLESIRGLEIGTPRGFSLGTNIDAGFEEGVLVKTEVPHSLAGVKMLASSRVQSMASDRLTFLYMLRESSMRENIEIVEPPLNRTPAYIGYSKKASHVLDLRDRIDQELAKMWNEGVMEEITNKYIK